MTILYFCNFDSNTVLITNLIGDETEPCEMLFNQKVGTPAGVFVQNGLIYWSNMDPNQIMVANVLGDIVSNVRQITGGFLDGPNGLWVHPITNKIYWANSAVGTNIGDIRVGDLDGDQITNDVPLVFPDPSTSPNNNRGEPTRGFIDSPNGLAIDTTTTPETIYWTNFADNTMYVGQLIGNTVTDARSLTNGMPPSLIDGPSSLFFDSIEKRIYWTNYNTNSIFHGAVSGSVITDIRQMTGPNFFGLNGICLVKGQFDNSLKSACDPTCAKCNEIFVRFNELARETKPFLNLQNNSDQDLFSKALSLLQTYCVKNDWKTSSKISASAKDLVRIMNANVSDLTDIEKELKFVLLKEAAISGSCDNCLNTLSDSVVF